MKRRPWRSLITLFALVVMALLSVGGFSTLMEGVAARSPSRHAGIFSEGVAHASGTTTGCVANLNQAWFDTNGHLTINGSTPTPPGVYCFTGDVDYTGTVAPINITASSGDAVVVDMNGYSMFCTGNCLTNVVTSQIDGIDINAYRHVTVRNGTIAQFYQNINNVSASNVIIQDMMLIGGSWSGISVGSGGVHSTAIRNNYLQSNLEGLSIQGSGQVIVENNQILDSSTSSGYGAIIFTSNYTGYGFVANNRLSGGYYGIYQGGSSAHVVYRDNIAQAMSYSSYYPTTQLLNAGNNY